jgi:hypothetical protein
MRPFGTDEVLDEASQVLRQGSDALDQASAEARAQVPLVGRPQLTMIATAAVAGAVGAATGRPVLAALLGAGLGWFAHRTWMR